MSYSPSLRKARMAQAVERSTVQLDIGTLPPGFGATVGPPVEIEIRDLAEPFSASLPIASDGTQASEICPEDETVVIEEVFDLHDPNCPIVIVPTHWSKGALLNVRNRGDAYVITLYPEEFDPRHPERALTFPNTWTCQDFVSRWYAREAPDPRAR